MSLISLLWFGGMAPRMGEQHLSKPHSTEAENCNLYSGELRPLKKPALAHQFCRPGDDCFFEPLEDDPSWPPVQPPPPLVCVAVAIETQPGTPAVPIGGTATLSVGVNADATAPVYYQWFKNNELMPGETAQVLSVDVVAETSHDQYVVMVTNPCGEGVSIPTKINLDPPPQCLPYDCDAMTIESAGIQGGGTWSLLDANWEPVIPEKFQESGPNNGGADLVSLIGGGASWTRTPFIGRATLQPADADLCEDPIYCLRNQHNDQTGTQDGLKLDPSQRPKWGGAIPNINIAVVTRAAEYNEFTGAAKNFLFKGAVNIRAWGQVSTTNGSLEQRIQITRREVNGEMKDVVEFNSNQGNYDWDAVFDEGLITGSEPVLLQVSMNCGTVFFEPTDTQTYFYASYDMIGTFNYDIAITTAAGVTHSQSATVQGRITQCFDRTHGNANTRPIAEEYKPWDDGTGDSQNFLTGGWGGMYNLALAYGTLPGVDNKISGAAAGGGVNSNLQVAWRRNFADYELPPECL